MLKTLYSYFSDPGVIELIIHGFLAMALGLSIKVMLALVKQRWVSTYHHTMTYALLPVITFTITKVITGNIALSLGMVGALSIIRFRNPVKNPFELVMFFALITIGIAISVNFRYGLLLVVIIDFVIFASYIFESIAKKFGLHIFSLSFDEGNSSNVIEIQSTSEIDFLHKSKYLLQFVSDNKEQEFHYRLASRSKKDIENIRESLTNYDHIINIEMRFS